MSWFTDFLSGGESPITAIKEVILDLHETDQEKAQAEVIIKKLEQHPAELQAAINKIEASHRSVLVAGWRPFIGWICGLSLGVYFIPQYIMAAYVWTDIVLNMTDFSHGLPAYPATTDGLMELTVSLLGIAGYRTIEKAIGKAK